MAPKLSKTVLLQTAAILIIYFTFSGCEKPSPWNDGFTPPFDLNVKLQSADAKPGLGKNPVGFIEFRQDPDPAKIITLETWLTNMQPNHDYLLQRAANPVADPNCTSTAWLTLGKLLTPLAIHTDGKGNAHETLSRDITAIATGTQFRIHFQIIDAATLVPVLKSDCYMYEVR